MIREKGEAFAMYRGEENPLSNAFFITVEDPDRIEETTQTITELSFVSDAVYGVRAIFADPAC
ncbi:MAG: permease-like cell division protein FtsX [Merdibacter sp.]